MNGTTEYQIRAFVEREERLAASRSDLNEDSKELFAEARGAGYDVKALKKIIALRKKTADQISEEAAILDMYMDAMGMSA